MTRTTPRAMLPLLAATLAFTLVAATDAAAPTPAPTTRPAATWVVNLNPYQCSLFRFEGPTAIFELVLAPRASDGELWVMKPTGAVLPEGEVIFTVHPAETEVRAVGRRLTQGAARYGFYGPFIDRFEAATGVTGRSGGTRFLDLHFPRAGKAVAALRTCYDDLLASWGVDPARMASLQRKPTPLEPPGSWARNSDYPESAIKRDESGMAVVRVTIGPDGGRSDCVTVASSGSDSLDRATCWIVMKRGRYEPPLGVDGKPTSAPVVFGLIWTLPND